MAIVLAMVLPEGVGNPMPVGTREPAAVATDQSQYDPGTAATIVGTGFRSREEVELQVTRADGTLCSDPTHQPWVVQANAHGDFLTAWTVCAGDCAGAELVLIATGLESGQTATANFLDAANPSLSGGSALASGNTSSGGGSSATLQGWLNISTAWGGTVQGSNSRYGEGDTLPLRFTASLAPGTKHTVLLKYDFSSGGSGRFFDSLGSYDATVSGVNLLAGITNAGSALQWAIPADTNLPAGAQLPGVLTTCNLSSLSVGAYSLLNGVKMLPVTFVVAGASGTNKTVVIGYGGHLAAESVWGVNNGASKFPGASRKAYASLDGASDLNVPVNPGTIVPAADLAITKLATPNPVYSGDNLTYQLTVQNKGPDSASAVVAQDRLPPGTVLVSATASQGTVSGTNNLTFALGTLAYGSYATISIVATVTSTAASITNTATVASGTYDPVSTNNASIVVTGIRIRDVTPPVISCPANIVQGTDPGLCSAKVFYNVTASDNSGSVLLVVNPPSGYVFPKGTNVVSCLAVDPSGNTNACSFTVTVLDTEPPQIVCPGAISVPADAGRCSAVVNYPAPQVTDNCPGAVAVTFDPPSGSSFPIGTNIVVATAVDAANNTNSCVFPVVVQDAGNQVWPSALSLDWVTNAGVLQAGAQQCLTALDQSRWFRFHIQPGSRLIVTLTELPENYDLVLFKDIATAYQTLASAGDLARLSAEFASDAFSPSAFSPDAFSPSAFSPSAYSPSAFSPSAFSPSAFSPSAFSPSAFSPSAFSPDAYAPSAFSPSAYSPSAFSPSAYSPSAFSPSAYSAAQLQSVLAVSAFDGVTSEGVVANTWDNTGDFYVRVRGRNGVFSPGNPFRLTVYLLPGACGSVSPVPVDAGGTPLPVPTTAAPAGNFKTLILTDLNRWLGPGPSTARSNVTASLAALAARPEVAGVVLDIDADPWVAFFNAQADANYDCPVAKNLLATAIKGIVDRSLAGNALSYVVLVGDDNVIPFFRYQDEALLGPERNFVPPLKDANASQASLRLNHVLGQDAYGSACEFSLKAGALPLPDLAVGRLVQTPDEVMAVINAYLSTSNGVAPTPASALVTGYDFLADCAQAVQNELSLGLGAPVDTLISPNTLAPSLCWTADNLRQALLSARHDLVFLAGHFSASETLAADYATHLLASEVAASAVDLHNAIIFSAGCHSGYSLVPAHIIPYVTLQPDWARTFAQKGATLIAGTGYQYGDTDFIEYGERLYLEFAQQLRTGAGPVAVGQALLNAKRVYLSTTPQMRGIHAKTYLEATLYGLPMLSLNLPGARRTDPVSAPSVTATAPFASNPGATLGLSFADLAVTPTLAPTQLILTNTEDNTQVVATYLADSDGLVNNPAEPILPLEVRNATVAGTVLRGVGFRGGAYQDLVHIVPLTGAATTEIRGIHATFLSEVFYPMRPWGVNYFGALCGGNGETKLMVIPAQFKSDSPTAASGTLRQFSQMNFRLFYSANTQSYTNASGDVSTPGLSAPPVVSAIVGTTSPASNSVALSARVIGSPAAGIQSVWVTFTALSGPYAGQWQSIDLVQDATDSTLWAGTLPLNGTPSQDVRYMVQAVNGVGLVALDTKLGAYYKPDEFDSGSTAQLAPTHVSLLAGPATGAFNTTLAVSAQLTATNGTLLTGQRMVFSLGEQELWSTTDSNGVATATLPLRSLPADYQVIASFPGAPGLAPSFATTPFTITRQATTLTMAPTLVYVKPNTDTRLVASLTDGAGNRILERTVLFVVSGTNGSAAKPVITDANGRAPLGAVPLGAGNYSVTAYFDGVIPLPGQTITVDDGRYLPSTTAGVINVTLVVDDRSPVITCPTNIFKGTDAGRCDAVVNFAVGASDDNPGVAVVCTPPSGSVFPAGMTTVNCVATDAAGNTSQCSFTVTVADTQPPAITCPADIVVPADPGASNAVVAYSVSATDNCSGVTITSAPPSGTAFPIGTNTIHSVATDGAGNQAACAFRVIVRDLQPPVITSVTASPNVLYPPNHTMVLATVNIVATDNSGWVTSRIISVTSSDPTNTTGDGNTSGDWLINGPLTVYLRAERSQSGVGRTYTITVQSSDLSGNTATGTTTVLVPASSSTTASPTLSQ